MAFPSKHRLVTTHPSWDPYPIATDIAHVLWLLQCDHSSKSHTNAKLKHLCSELSGTPAIGLQLREKGERGHLRSPHLFHPSVTK
eukprot:4465-Karenia_brevis.AAC.1